MRTIFARKGKKRREVIVCNDEGDEGVDHSLSPATTFVEITGNVNTATMSVKTLSGKSYLVGPVIMAREIVMNELLYTADDLKISVPHWNGRPIVVNHPKDDEGNFLSANDPTILEKTGIGLVFNTSVDKKARLKAEAWIDMEAVKNHKKVEKKIADGEMLEVSTGLFLYPEKKKGEFGGRKYKGVARNHKPDHLAILPDVKGACSVEDGAGFPRANEMLEVNELSGGEMSSLLGKAIRRKYNANGSYAYLVDVYATEKYLIFERFNSQVGEYELYKTLYDIAEDEQTVTFSGEPVKVILRKQYVDSLDANVIKQKQQTDDTTSTPSGKQPKANGETTMKKAEQINSLLASKRIDANEAEFLSGLSDEKFAVYAKGFTAPGAPHNPKQTLPGTDGASNDGTDDGDNDDDADGDEGDGEGAGNSAEKPAPKKTAVVPQANDDVMEWAKAKHAEVKGNCIATIKANKANTFSDAALQAMNITQLEAIASIAGNQTDMTPAGQPVPKVQGNQAPKVPAPYIPKSVHNK